MQDKAKLINIIEKAIEKYEKELKSSNNNSSNKYRGLIESLENNIYALTDIDISLIEELLSESNLSPEEIIALRNNISTYKKLLTLNKNGKTNFTLSDSQIKDISLLLSIAKELGKGSLKIKDKSKVQTKIDYLKSLLKLINDENNTTLITDLNTIEEICNECQLSIDSKKEILYAILLYNQSVFVNDIRNNFSTPHEKLELKDVIKLFKEFSYDFNDIKNTYQNEVLTYATLTNMREVFETLRDLDFPKFNLKRDGKKLCSLLICSNRRTIEEIVDYSNRKGIKTEELIYLIPALISQDTNSIEKDYISIDTCIITGRCNEYKKNIEFLESIGFDIRYIFHSYKLLLIKRHTSLVTSYNHLQEYGIEINENNGGELVHSALTSLVLKDFTKRLDSSIESSTSKTTKKINIENLDIFKNAINEANEEVIYNKTIGNKALDLLDSYTDSTNEIRYDFNGIYISKPKVNRIFNILINKNIDNLKDSLLFSITYNTNLKEEQFNTIKNIIEGWN